MTWCSNWDDIYKKSIWGRYPSEELIRFIARQYYNVSKREDIRILEVGCGPGPNIWYLAREGFKIFGIDGSKTAIHQANLTLNKENLISYLEIGDVINLPFRNNFFDCIIDIECIYANTFADSINIIKEINRVLKEGGMFFSKSFMKGTSGDENGITVNGEANTYIKIFSGPLNKNYGIQRISSLEDIKSLYSIFNIESIDYTIRSSNNQEIEIREWIVVCKKSSE